jgi:uncharacterized YccA/Bax inhibitor family protein
MALEFENPVIKESTFQEAASGNRTGNVMTINGTVGKMAFLLLMVMAAAIYSWGALGRQQNLMPFLLVGGIGGFVLALIITFKQDWAPFLAPAYALAEGFFLGVISVLYNARFEGIVFQAVSITFGVFLAMLILYRSRIIRVNDTFRSVMFTAVAGIGLFYLLVIVLRLFGMDMPFLHDGSILSIVISLVIAGVAAFNLMLYFDMIESGAQYGAPKYMEWYSAFGLLVNLIWLYLEILRLLANVNRRN